MTPGRKVRRYTKKAKKKSVDFLSNWRFQSQVFQIWRSGNFDILWNFSLERPSIFLRFHGTFKREHPLWKRPLHEKSTLFFWPKRGAPSDRASYVNFLSVEVHILQCGKTFPTTQNRILIDLWEIWSIWIAESQLLVKGWLPEISETNFCPQKFLT